jgi:four helix bundle protein
MISESYDYQKRTRQLALRVIALVDTLPNTCSATVIGEHLVRAATAAAANYRAATRTSSKVEMLAKLGAVEEEGDQALFWLETLAEAGIVPQSELATLMQEIDATVAMIHVAVQTLRDSLKRVSPADCRRKSKFEKQTSIDG